jgi:hypothetical protein
VLPFRVFSQTNLVGTGRPSSLNPRPVNLLQPLVQLQKSQLLYNQADPASFCKTPGVGTCTIPPHASLPPLYAPRGASIPCGLRGLRILPVTKGVYPPRTSGFFGVRGIHNLLALCFHTLTNRYSRNPFRFTSIQIPGGCGSPFVLCALSVSVANRFQKGGRCVRLSRSRVTSSPRSSRSA